MSVSEGAGIPGDDVGCQLDGVGRPGLEVGGAKYVLVQCAQL